MKRRGKRRVRDTQGGDASAPSVDADHLIWGRHAVLEGLRSGARSIHKILLAKGAKDPRHRAVVESARARNIPLQRVPRPVLDQLTRGAKHQGVVASVAAREYVDAEDLLGRLSSDALLVILDEIEDPHNLGAIIRTAHCAGAEAVVITKHRSAGLTDVVANVSAGAIEYIPLARVTNLASFIERLRETGVQVLGVDPAAPRAYIAHHYRGALAFVFGSEGKGLRRLTRERCDGLVAIPLKGQLDSLNVSVTVGVVLFEVLRQRAKRE